MMLSKAVKRFFAHFFSITLFFVAGCGQEQPPVAEPAPAPMPAESATTPPANQLLPHQALAREILKETHRNRYN